MLGPPHGEPPSEVAPCAHGESLADTALGCTSKGSTWSEIQTRMKQNRLLKYRGEQGSFSMETARNCYRVCTVQADQDSVYRWMDYVSVQHTLGMRLFHILERFLGGH